MKSFIFVVCLVGVLALTNMATAQNIATAVNIAEFTVSNPLVVEAVSAPAGELAPGVSYYFATNGDINPPDAGGNTTLDPLLWTVTGQAGSRVTVTFNLPDRFADVDVGADFPIIYGPADGLFDNSQAGDGLTGDVFDPRVPYTDFLGSGAAADIYLAFRVNVPANLPAGDYFANFYCTVAATGL